MSSPWPPRGATRLLVSVRDAEEAARVAATGPCLVDAKDPQRGALGALPIPALAAIVAAVGGRAPTSAVAGEPATWDGLVDAVAATAATGVDMVKVAWPVGARRPPPGLRFRVPSRCPVVAVFFAERDPGPAAVAMAGEAGCTGAMIDTERKDGRSLRDHFDLGGLAAFVAACQAHGMMSGLAGSLRIGDIPALAALGPTYLGFRGGLCGSGDRRGALDMDRVAEAMSVLGSSIRAANVA